MDNKRILIVSRSFYPQNSPRAHRTTELSAEFARQGHEVKVLTPKNSEIHSDFELKHNLIIGDLGKLRWKSPDFGKTRVGHLLTRSIFRLLSLGFEYPDIELMFKVAKKLKNEKDYDILISIAVPYPIHWGVAKRWKKNQQIAKVWIADCGDPYMGCDTDSFRKWWYFKYVEKWFMRKTDFITIPVESARRSYYEEFHSKIKVIPQGFKIHPIAVSKKQRNDVLSFAYVGGFIKGIRDPRAFLNFLIQINKKFIFYIFTNNKEIIDGFEQTLADKLKVMSYIPRTELLTFLSKMDFVVNFDNNTETAVPSKLIDYKIVNKPILNITNKLNTKVIEEFLDRNYSNQMVIKNIDQYRIENVTAQFLALAENKFTT